MESKDELGRRRKPQRETDRPTEEQRAEYEDYAFQLLAQGKYKHEIKKEFKEKFGLLPRTVERYLARARERILAEAARGKDEVRAESLGFYRAMTQEANATVREKILARERMDKLLGLDAPQKIAPTTPDGESEYRQLTDAELNARIIAELTASAPGGVAPAPGTEGREKGMAGGREDPMPT